VRAVVFGDGTQAPPARRQTAGDDVASGIDETHRLVGELGDRRVLPQLLRRLHDLVVALTPGAGAEDVAHGSADDQSRSKPHGAIMPGPTGYFTTRSCGVRLSLSPPFGVTTTGSDTK